MLQCVGSPAGPRRAYRRSKGVAGSPSPKLGRSISDFTATNSRRGANSPAPLPLDRTRGKPARSLSICLDSRLVLLSLPLRYSERNTGVLPLIATRPINGSIAVSLDLRLRSASLFLSLLRCYRSYIIILYIITLAIRSASDGSSVNRRSNILTLILRKKKI